MPTDPSRSRFEQYRETVRKRNASGEVPLRDHRDRNPKKLGDRERNFWELLRAFWGLISQQRPQIASALTLLTIGICLRLVPPLGTKLAIDSALTAPPKPLPSWLS